MFGILASGSSGSVVTMQESASADALVLDVGFQTSRTLTVPAAANGKKAAVYYNAEIQMGNAGCDTVGKIRKNGSDITVSTKSVETGVASTSAVLPLQTLIASVATGDSIDVQLSDALSEQATATNASLLVIYS